MLYFATDRKCHEISYILLCQYTRFLMRLHLDFCAYPQHFTDYTLLYISRPSMLQQHQKCSRNQKCYRDMSMNRRSIIKKCCLGSGYGAGARTLIVSLSGSTPVTTTKPATFVSIRFSSRDSAILRLSI